MFRNRAEQTGSVVAQEMDRIMGSEDHKAVFHKPGPQVKTASDKDDKKKAKKDKKCECDSDCKCKDKEKKSAADHLQLAIKGMAKISESLDNIGLEKSALVTLKALDTIVTEAMGLDMSDSCDANYAKDKKEDDKKDDDNDNKKEDKKEDDKDEDKKEDKDDKEDDKDEDKKEDKDDKEDDKKKDKKDDNDANDPLADIEKRMEQERSGLGPDGVIQSGKSQETIPAPPGSGYDRIPADSNNDEDRRVNHGLMPIEQRQKALEFETPSHPVRGVPAPEVDTEEKHKREYKHPWERDSFEINMADDDKEEKEEKEDKEEKEVTVEIVDDGEDLRKIMEELGIDLE